MNFYHVTAEELGGKSHKPPICLVNELEEFIKSSKEIARVEDNRYNNNNDLRRAIQYCIEANNLPLHVFMKYGKTYIEREGL